MVFLSLSLSLPPGLPLPPGEQGKLSSLPPLLLDDDFKRVILSTQSNGMSTISIVAIKKKLYNKIEKIEKIEKKKYASGMKEKNIYFML